MLRRKKMIRKVKRALKFSERRERSGVNGRVRSNAVENDFIFRGGLII